MPDSSTDSATSPDQRRAVLDRLPKGLLIGGEWRDASGGGSFAVHDPATEEVLVEIADGQPGDATAALDAAVAAQPEWAATPPRQRGEILRRA
jgi:succinate-semialdehyde dehydrogenase / glutarate-semialdehyde dehydrogenase